MVVVCDAGLFEARHRRVPGPVLFRNAGLYDGVMPDFEVPAPDAVKLLAQWMEWERGEETPGRVIANLKTGGMRELLESLAAALPA